MRSISVLKILQITMGLSGIFIVILGVGYLGSLKGGFIQLLVSSPLSAGLLTGLPLIPLIHSAKQKFVLTYYDEIGHADYEGAIYQDTSSYELPVSAWLWKTRTGVFQETQPSTDLKLITSWSGDAQKQNWVGSGNDLIDYQILEKLGTSDSIAEYQHTYPIHTFLIEDAVDANDSGALYQETKLGGPGLFFEQGQLAFANVHMDERTGNDTTGLTNIVMEAVFIVACLRNKGNDPDELAPWVSIVGDTPVNPSGFSWPANTNARVVNMMVILWQGNATSSQGWFVADKNAIDLDMSTDAVEMHAKAWLRMLFPLQDGTGAGTTYAPINTAYKRGPLYLKKGENLQFRHRYVQSTFTIQFQYIPDYGYTSEFSRRYENSNFQDNALDNQFMPLFVAPYDLYVTTVKGNIAYITDNSTTDAIWSMELMAFKGKNYLDANDLLLEYANANVLGNILGADHNTGQQNWSLKTITIVSDNVDGTTNTTGAGKVPYAEAIADYYPAGSTIGFWFPADMSNNLSQLVIEMHVEGLNRIKTQNAGTILLKSDMVAVHGQ